MIRVITINVNGIRSAAQKGFFQWLTAQHADVVCFQETKAQEHQLQAALFSPPDYHRFFFDAEKKGYSGVAIYTRIPPDHVHYGLDLSYADQEGRYIQVDFGRLSIASLYLPSGTMGEERQAVKFRFMKDYLPRLQEQRKDGRSYILCGDWNIAHKKIDLKNWASNQKTSGFLPEERAWMDTVLEELEFVDAFRHLNPDAHQYTWWSHRARAFENNVGWRIDYQIITPDLKSLAQSTHIYREPRFSDHAPLVIDYDLSLK